MIEKTKHSKYSEDKKQREYQLIEQFLQICDDFSGYNFSRFSENPDMIYLKNSEELGFDSVIISEDQAVVDCYFHENMCEIGIPTKLSQDEKLNKIEVFFENKLFSHFRRYSVPTVLVFTLLDTRSTSIDDLVSIAKRFKLPELTMYNIVDYYITDNSSYVKIAETK